MKKILVSLALATAVFASGGFTGAGSAPTYQQGGFTGKGSMGAGLVSVKEALSLKDDTLVTLEGKIRSQIRKEHYEFVDKNGDVIEIEIDDDKWMGVSVDENTPIRIFGEVDKGLVRTKIDVDRVEIIR